MADNPAVAAALRENADIVNGVTPNPQDVALARGYAQPAQSDFTYDYYVRPRGLRDYINYGLRDAYQRSGPYYSPAGARAGYEDYGFPAPIFQSDPYAWATGRTYTAPDGTLGWQALQGFPSRYPHVLNGVPNSPFRGMSLWPQMMPLMWPYFPMMGMGMPQQPAAPAQTAPSGGGQKTTAPSKTTMNVPQSNPEMVHYGTLRAIADYLPVSESNRVVMGLPPGTARAPSGAPSNINVDLNALNPPAPNYNFSRGLGFITY